MTTGARSTSVPLTGTPTCPVASSGRNGPHPSTAGNQRVTGSSSPAGVPFGSCPKALWPTWTSAYPGAVSGTTSHPPTSRTHPHSRGVDARLREPRTEALRIGYGVSPRPLIRTARGAPAAPRGRSGPRVEGRRGGPWLRQTVRPPAQGTRRPHAYPVGRRTAGGSGAQRRVDPGRFRVGPDASGPVRNWPCSYRAIPGLGTQDSVSGGPKVGSRCEACIPRAPLAVDQLPPLRPFTPRYPNRHLGHTSGYL